ncbi:MAG: hypothetical protein JNJ73_16625 [Hyphomonadaceae bacterium]|nr:hypothetical protein [Hyphomonadaceae bacterium]
MAGGWLLCSLIVSWAWAAFVALGIERREAVILTPLLAILLYLVVLTWAFGESSFTRLCAAMALGIAVSFGIQHGLASHLGLRS